MQSLCAHNDSCADILYSKKAEQLWIHNDYTTSYRIQVQVETEEINDAMIYQVFRCAMVIAILESTNQIFAFMHFPALVITALGTVE